MNPKLGQVWMIRTGTCATLLALGAAMLLWPWGTWPDVLVDFGYALYVPWRLAQGDILYADQAYATGPLSPYFNALLFRVIGVGLRTLVLANLTLLVVLVVLLYRLLRRLASRSA